MGFVHLLASIAFFVLANLVTYGVYNGVGFTAVPPGILSLMIQIVIALFLYAFGVTIPFFSELIIAEGIVIAVNRVLLYLTGTSF